MSSFLSQLFFSEFPVYLQIGSWQIESHLIFECLAYIFAFRFLLKRSRQKDFLTITQRTWIVIGALLGAIIGTKVLVLLQHLDLAWENRQQFFLLFLFGKTIVGSLLGGLIAVELTKKMMGIKRSTGDVFVYPLIIGTAIGRIGCFLTGLSDRTYGIATNLPWGVDFGDGILRHPTQLYEIIFLLGLMTFLQIRSRYQILEGDLFKFYLTSYLGFRLLIDFLKPDFHYFWGLTAIQTTCLITLIYYHRSLTQIFQFKLKSKTYA